MRSLNQVWIAKGLIAVCLVGMIPVARYALAETVSVRNLDKGVDPFPESRFGAAPYRERISKTYQNENAWKDFQPARGIASVPSGEGFSSRAVEEMESREDQAPASHAVTSGESRLQPKNARGVQEFSIIASDLGYFPKTIFVNPEVPVRLYITGASKKSLCIMMDTFQVRRQVRSQQVEEIEFTPSQPGKFRYYCPVNGIEGAMVVREITGE